MPRQARFIVPDIALHVIQRGHNRNACFRDDTDRMVATIAHINVTSPVDSKAVGTIELSNLAVAVN